MPIPLADHCVARARAVAERKAIKVLSLDVFDTLLWRVVPEPVDAFALVGRSLLAAGHLQLPAEAFAPLREAAERRARARGQRERSTSEVTLEEVYQELPAAVVGDASPVELAGVEVEVERSITFPDLSVIDLVHSLQASLGPKVILVSNTYFSATQLRRLLDREPFTSIHLDGVFTSSDHRRHKGSGLFDVALRTLGVGGGQVMHLGDDPDSDIACSSEVGIHGVVLTRRPEPLPIVLQREGVERGDAVRRHRAPLHEQFGDFGLTALRAKALRRPERTSLDPDEEACWATGAAVFGPVLTAFAEWVHDRAEALGASRVFCVMREGAFLAPLLEASRRQRGGGAEVSTLWLSRYVCTQAAILSGSTSEVEAFLQRRRAPTLGQACEGLGLTPQHLRDLADRGGDRLDDPALRRRFFQAVTEDDEVRAEVVAHCSVARRRLVEYVTRTLGRGPGEEVLVDIGWGATIQVGLDAALRGEGVRLPTRGLYLITNDVAAERVLDGMAVEGFLGTFGLPDPAVRWIIRSPEVLEQMCMPEVGSLIGFDDQGQPVTAPPGGDVGQHAQRRAVQDGVFAFQEVWARYRGIVPAEHHTLDERARPLLLRTLLRFVVDPTCEEARVFGSWVHDENWGSASSETVLSGVVAERLRYLSPLQLLEIPMTRLYWPFGLAALHNPPLARAAAAVAFGELPPDVFTGQDTHVTVYIDYGVGLLPRRQVAVQANSQGLYYLRQHVEAHPLRAVAIGFPPGPGLVRLEWMQLHFHRRGQSEPTIVDVRWPGGDPRLRYHDAVVLSGNLVHGPHRRPRLSFECPAEWGLDAYSVEVEVGFGWLASAPGAPPTLDRAAVALALARRAYPRARAALQLGRALATRLRQG